LQGFHPDVEFVSSTTAAVYGQGEFHGREGMRDFAAQFDEVWDSFHLEPLEYIPVGDHVVTVLREIGSGRRSGVTVEEELAHIWTFRDGLAIRHANYPTREAALKAVGLSEQDAHHT
jgi:ketosteroid isomerase-like protein